MKRQVPPTLAAAAVFLAGSLSQATAAPLIQFNGSDITGVTGVSYNGQLYDATFNGSSFNTANGTGGAIYFTTQADAIGISTALEGAGLLTYVSPSYTFAGKASSFNSSINYYRFRFETAFSVANNQVSSEGLTATARGPGNSTAVAGYNIFNDTFATNIVPDNIDFVVWTAEASPVPEPASLALLGAAAAALAASRKRRK